MRCLAALLTLLALSPLSQDARAQEPIVAGHVHALASDALGETRRYSVYTPRGYADGAEAYPVLYMTDGEWNFLQTAGLVDQLSRWARVPDMIVVAVHNTNRTRDLTPSADSTFYGSGGASAFLRFLTDELVPHVEGTYRTSGYRILWGHSFGGLFAFYALAERPDAFEAYLSAGASLWLTDHWIIDRMADRIRRTPDLEAFLYFTAGEGDGGPTLPSNLAMRDLLEQRAPAGLEWHYATTDRENHFSNVPITLQQGLQARFPIWGADDALLAAARSEGPAGVTAWRQQRERALGPRFVLTEFEQLVVGYTLLQEGRLAEASAVFEMLIDAFPDSGMPLDALGTTRELQGETEQAAALYRRALRVGTEQGEPERHLHTYRTHLARVTG